MAMPPGFPTADKFPADQVKDQTDSWNFHRDPGQGGQNFGVDFIAHNDAAVVDFEINVISDHGTKGDPDIHLVMKSVGVLQMPVGVHVGHRLEPGDIFGPRATFKGEVRMKVVSPQAWVKKALEGIPL